MKEKSQGFIFLVKSFLLMIFYFTKQGLCTTNLAISIQSTTHQLRIGGKNWFFYYTVLK